MRETRTGLLSGHGCTERGPFLVIDELATCPWTRQRVAVVGEELTLEVRPDEGASRPRRCTGRYDLARGRGEPCPDRAALRDEGYQQCRACFDATGFNPAFYHATSVSPQQTLRNRKPHAVYLAWFGPGTVKVGMSLAARGPSRLLEQGARLGVVLHTFANAARARELEEELARLDGIAEVVRSSKKRHLLGAPIHWSAARQELRHHAERASDLCDAVASGSPMLELDRYYGRDDLLARPPTDLTETAPLGISGVCLGMIGDVLVTESHGGRFMLSVSGGVGWPVYLGATARRNRVSGQLAFGF